MNSASNHFEIDIVKVLYVLPTLPIGGVGSYILNVINNIDDERFMISIVVCDNPDPNNRFQQQLQKKNVTTTFLPRISIFSIEKVKQSFYSYFKQNHDFNIIEIHAPNMVFLVAKQIKELTSAKLIVHFHNAKLSTNKLKSIRNYFLEKKYFKYVDCFVSCGAFVAEQMKRIYKINSNKMFVFLNGMTIKRNKCSNHELELLRNDLHVQGKKICLAVGNCVKQKNYDFLIKVFSYLEKNSDGIHLLVAGGGPLLAKHLKTVKTLGIKNVSFLGNRNDVDKLMNIADMFVMPSLNEGLPLAGIECQTYGLPSLFSTDVTPEIMINENIRFLELSKGHKQWAKTIQEMICLPKSDLERMLVSKFNIKKSIIEIEETYDAIINNREVLLQ